MFLPHAGVREHEVRTAVHAVAEWTRVLARIVRESSQQALDPGPGIGEYLRERAGDTYWQSTLLTHALQVERLESSWRGVLWLTRRTISTDVSF